MRIEMRRLISVAQPCRQFNAVCMSIKWLSTKHSKRR